MCETSQLRFANEYARADYDVRMQIDRAQAAYRKQDGILGIMSLSGRAFDDVEPVAHIVLGAAGFDEKGFTDVLERYQTIARCYLLVKAQNIFPPLSILSRLADAHPKCEFVRASVDNMSFEYRPCAKILELASAQSSRCGTCARASSCSAAALVNSPLITIPVRVINPDDVRGL